MIEVKTLWKAKCLHANGEIECYSWQPGSPETVIIYRWPIGGSTY